LLGIALEPAEHDLYETDPLRKQQPPGSLGVPAGGCRGVSSALSPAVWPVPAVQEFASEGLTALSCAPSHCCPPKNSRWWRLRCDSSVRMCVCTGLCDQVSRPSLFQLEGTLIAKNIREKLEGFGADLRRGSGSSIRRSRVGNSPDAVVDDQEPGICTSSLPSPSHQWWSRCLSMVTTKNPVSACHPFSSLPPPQ
jgi:hypothetical protein